MRSGFSLISEVTACAPALVLQFGSREITLTPRGSSSFFSPAKPPLRQVKNPLLRAQKPLSYQQVFLCILLGRVSSKPLPAAIAVCATAIPAKSAMPVKTVLVEDFLVSVFMFVSIENIDAKVTPTGNTRRRARS